MTKLHELHTYGQSIWLDFISREILENGELDHLLEQGIRGVTSNPSIFDKAISGSGDYDVELAALSSQGADAFAMYDALSQADIRTAADKLLPLYQSSNAEDGYVSLEVSPDLAYDTEGTISEARRLWQSVDRPNLMVKVPATAEGIPAINQLISEGININATLMFSLADYEAVAYAYIEGLEKRAGSGGDLSRVASVASFFVSRIDGVVDKQLEKAGNSALQGKIAIANAHLAYRRFMQVFSGPRWEALVEKGANYQRPLWASTSAKNPSYPDILYVDNLIGAHTVNTLPLPTIKAVLDHSVVATTVNQNYDQAQGQIEALAPLGIDFQQITDDLQTAGVKSFADSFHSLLESVQQRAASL
jgi:transaldolase